MTDTTPAAVEITPEQIDVLRFKAFKTNARADTDAYYKAASKYFQDRFYRAMDRERDYAALSAQLERLKAERDYDRRQSVHLQTVVDRLNGLIDRQTTEYHSQLEAANQRAEGLDKALAKARADGKAEGLRDAALEITTAGDSAVTEALGQRLCCNGHHCGCQGITVEQFLVHTILALIPADTPAANQQILADPSVVHINMLRGTIARPSVEQIIHIYGADTLIEGIRAIAGGKDE